MKKKAAHGQLLLSPCGEINPDTDTRFVKNGNSAVNNLLTYYVEKDRMFAHQGTESNAMATDQTCYALVAYNRFMNGKTALFDYSDVSEDIVIGKPKATLGMPSEITDDIGVTFNVTVSIDQWNNEAGYKLIDLIVNIPDGLSVASVTASNRLKVALLTQNPQALFVKKTVREDLFETLSSAKISKAEKEKQVARVVALCELSGLLDRHPYDISGGEQQRTALAKVLITAPDILLLDEPTKGLDAQFKVTFANIIKQLTAQGVCVLMVSRDVAFCAEYAHKCGMFFDGNLVAEGTPRKFFSGNSFYTTSANRMARHLIHEAVTVNDIILSCGGETSQTEEENEILPLPKPSVRSTSFKPEPLKLWRKILAATSGLTALGVFLYATGITDLSALINASGISTQGKQQLSLYGLLFASLSLFLFAIGRRSEPPIAVQTPKDKRSLSKRTTVASVAILLFIPLTIFAGIFYLDDRHYNIVALLVLLECMMPFVLIFEGRKPKARELVTIAVLCAIGIAGRSLFFMLPQFKPVLALTIITGVAFGGEAGFLVGAVTMLLSNMLFSQGPWTPWQMFSMGIIGFLAGVLFKKGWLRRSRISLAVFGAFTAVIIYGGIMNPAAAFMVSSQTVTLKTLMAYYISGLPMDLVHGFGTALFIMLAAEPMLEKPDRIKVKYGLVE